MYNQPRYDTQERQPFFADQRSMRPQVEGTVSREMEKAWSCRDGTLRETQGYIGDAARQSSRRSEARSAS